MSVGFSFSRSLNWLGSNKAITSEVSTFSYDIEDYAAQHGYDTAEEMVKDDNTPMTVVLNGEVINEGTSSNTFIKVLQKIGLETFADKIVADNILVRKEGEENRVWRRVDNYFVYIGWWANYKKSWLQNMAKELEIDLKVE